MRAAGIVRQVDNLGRIVLPKELRRRMGIEHGTPIAFDVADDGMIVLYPVTEAAEERRVRALRRALEAIEAHMAGRAVDWWEVRAEVRDALKTDASLNGWRSKFQERQS